MKPNAFAQNKALLWIQEQLKAFPEDRLPSLRAGSAICGVSLRSFQQAILQLKQQGIIESRPGSGLWPKGKVPLSTREVLRNRMDWCARIEESFRHFTFENGVLPPIKELCNRWNVSAPTLRKSLRVLQEKGVLERKGKTWHPKQPLSQSQSLEVWLVAASVGERLVAESPRVTEFCRALEEECQRNGFKLVFLFFDIHQPKMLFPKPSDLKRCIGVVVSTWLLPHANSVIQSIQRWNVPVSIWVENEELLPALPQLMRHKHLAWFNISYGTDSGKLLGQNLTQRGHNQVLYISPYHGATWSKNRWLGLQSSLKNTTLLADSRFRDTWGFQNAALQRIQPHKLHQAFSFPQTQLDCYTESPYFMARWKQHVLEYLQDLEVLQALKPLMKKAVNSSATAWVFASDHCAILALQLVSPEQRPLTIISFDNTPEARALGIESFEFNTQGMVKAMIEHLRQPQHPFHITGVFRQPKGHVVQRNKKGK